MHPTTAEQQWIQHLYNWSHNQEQSTLALQNKQVHDPGEMQQLQALSTQFAELREAAENQWRFPEQDQESQGSSIELAQLHQEAQRLNQSFASFMSGGFTQTKSEADHDDNSDYSVPIGGHTLPPLPYNYGALEPYISEEIMRLHHDVHHKGYVEGLNKAEEEMQKARKTDDYSLIRHWERSAAFNGAGHYLHTIFWDVMNPDGGGKPKGPIAKEIDRTFGDFEKFKSHFSNAAEKVQSVGWALLVWSPRSWRTEILEAEEHQNLSQQDMIPLLVLDVWEHAYYLQYKTNRGDYIDAWWNVVDWDSVNKRFNEAKKVKWEPF